MVRQKNYLHFNLYLNPDYKESNDLRDFDAIRDWTSEVAKE
jgi:hypothetical protein